MRLLSERSGGGGAAGDRPGIAAGPSRAVPLESIRLAAGGRAASVPLSGGAALSREAFDAALIEAAVAAGAAFLPETRAVLLEIPPKRGIADAARPLLLQQGDRRAETSARVVLAADGLGGSLLARGGEAEAGARIGAGAVTTEAPDFYRPGVVYMACGAGGYTGMVRLEDGRLDAAAAFDAAWLRAVGGPGRAAAQLVREAGWPPLGRLDDPGWRGTPALTRDRIASPRNGSSSSATRPATSSRSPARAWPGRWRRGRPWRRWPLAPSNNGGRSWPGDGRTCTVASSVGARSFAGRRRRCCDGRA